MKRMIETMLPLMRPSHFGAHIVNASSRLGRANGRRNVDCDQHKDLCSKYGVSGYPTIQWFPKGSLEAKKYEGRTAEALAEFINREAETNVKLAAAPSNVVVLSPEIFNQVALHETKDVLVEFYAPWLLLFFVFLVNMLSFDIYTIVLNKKKMIAS